MNACHSAVRFLSIYACQVMLIAKDLFEGGVINKEMTVVLVGENYFARQGIAGLLSGNPQLSIFSVGYHQLDTLLLEAKVDVLFMSGEERNKSRFDYLNCIQAVKNHNAEITICMYSIPANSLLWVYGDVDAYLSLREPLYSWRRNIIKMFDTRHRHTKRSAALPLTVGEWQVLKNIRNGLDMCDIARLEKLSYRRVSALKNSAIRKLGLRNKTDLLVFLTS